MESQKSIVLGSSLWVTIMGTDPAANASLQNTFSKDPEKDMSWVLLLLAVPVGLIYGFGYSLFQNGPFLSADILAIVSLIVAETVLQTKISLCCPRSFWWPNFSGI